MIMKITQNKTSLEVDIPCIYLTPNRYKALAPAIVYVSNDITIPVNSMMSQMNTIATKNLIASVCEWDQNHFEIYGSALKHNYNVFLYVQGLNHSVYIKGNQMKLFQ